MINGKKALSSLLLAVMFLLFNAVIPVLGAEEVIEYEPFIVVSSYEVSDDIIIPGKNFNLTIEVENTDPKVATRGALMTIGFPDGISTAYGSSNQIFLDKLAPGEKREVTFELYASPGYSRSLVPFVITITSEVRSISSTIYAHVELDRSSFKVVSQTVPEEADAGEKIAVSFSFKSLLEEKLSNVVLLVYVDNDEKPLASTNIGNISVGASKSQDLTFFISEVGRHRLRVELSFNLSEGEFSTAELYSGYIRINEASEESYMQINESQKEALTIQNKLIIVGCLGLSVLLGIGIVLIAKKYN